MSTLALDIGNYSIKAVLGKSAKAIKIEKVIEVLNPLGGTVPNDEAAIQKMSEHLDTFFNDNKLPRTNIRLALPESSVSTKVISIPPLTDSELASAIGWQAEQHIPIPLEELSLEYEVLYRPPRKEKDQNMRVLMIGVRKDVVNRFLNVFLDIGIEPKILETQALSVFRSLQFTPEDPTSLVVHMGASSMDTFVVQQGEISFVFSTLNGGSLLTKSLEQDVGLELKQAEEYKRNYGLDPGQFEGKIRNSLIPTVDVLVGEMLKSIQFFSQQHPQEKIQRLLLSGGGASLPGLVEYITNKLELEVLLSAPFSESEGEIPVAGHPAFTVCMGLLMRED
ncbi:MAG: type IV pilus assembly protein PilM [Patescibacteria group bacterium]